VERYLADLPGEITSLKERARAFVTTRLHPFEAEIAATGAMDGARLQDLRDGARAAGFSNVNLPPEHGGLDPSMVALVALEEEAGWATNGLGYLVADRGPRELLELATDEQLERFVLPVVRREFREAWAITEPGAGSDVAAIGTSAVRAGDDWILDGEKWFVTDGDHAGVVAVLARTGAGQATFLVPRGTAGMRVARVPRFMHDPYTSRHVELVLERCRVPDEFRIREEGGDGARRWFATERLMIAARCNGAAERLLELARDWAVEREAFGQPIGEHQGVQFMLADGLVGLSASRLLTYAAAEAADRDEDPRVVHGRIAIAKLHASETAWRIADDCLQVFGGRGYMVEHPAERYYRELRVDRIWEGTSEIQRSIIGRGLLKRGAGPYLP
jgi:acyl-CoA dehydrogenase